MKLKKPMFLIVMTLVSTFLSGATFTVTNTNENGAGSLRQAVLNSNGAVGADVIEFDINLGGVQTILLNSSLTITDEVFIDGSSQNINRGAGLEQMLIEIGGQASVSHCFTITQNASNSDVYHLVINDFRFRCIDIDQVDDIKVRGCYMGIAPNGLSIKGMKGVNAIYLDTTARCEIGGLGLYDRNVIGNCEHGIRALNIGTQNNKVFNCYIGVNKNGNAPLTVDYGIRISAGARNFRIGGVTIDSLNIISGATLYGVHLNGGGTTKHVIVGNHIGVDKDGSNAINNILTGVYLSGGAQAQIQNNTISGNQEHGVYIVDANSNATILGNHIGVNKDGLTDIPNGGFGIGIAGGADDIIIGDGTETGRNVISGNGDHGIYITGAVSDSNTIQGNYIGVNANGVTDISNGGGGIYINGGSGNLIGGSLAAQRNVISGNRGSGIELVASQGNVIYGNSIGLNANGITDISNAAFGISINNGSTDNVVGGEGANQRNIISGNQFHGIQIDGGGTENNRIVGNYIGTNQVGANDIPNLQFGVGISNGARNNVIGPANVVSGNNQHGIGIINSNSNRVIGNYIGVDQTGSFSVPNDQRGVVIENSDSSEIGSVNGQGNLISGNGGDGIVLDSSSYCLIAGNIIGLDAGGAFAIANGSDGIDLRHGCAFNQIGGTTALMRNVVSGNTDDGIQVGEQGADNNTVLGNYVGTDITGVIGRGNQGDGVVIYNGAQNNTIGGSTNTSRNVICDNKAMGVICKAANTSGNRILGNLIGVNVDNADLGNSGSGVSIVEASNSNFVGGAVSGAGNTISGNGGYGVYLKGLNVRGNTISGNRIGTDSLGLTSIFNGFSGMYLDTLTNNNIIGGATPAERNVISGNVNNGISLVACFSNVIIGNFIGTDSSGVVSLANNFSGISLSGAYSNQIGGSGDSTNCISGNVQYGVWINESDTNLIKGNWVGLGGDGVTVVPNIADGVSIVNTSQNNTVDDNVISGNGIESIRVNGLEVRDNVIIRNYIGTDFTGIDSALANTQGIRIEFGAHHNSIGRADSGNVIGYCTGSGVTIFGVNSDSNQVYGNLIGLAIDSVTRAGNLNGVYILAGAAYNFVGGSNRNEGNVIVNGVDGVLVQNVDTKENVIRQNLIGVGPDGVSSHPNNKGIVLSQEAISTIVGPENVISGNQNNAIEISDEGTDNTLVFENIIGFDVGESINLGNAGVGVYVLAGSDNSLIQGNRIGGSGNAGVRIANSSTLNTRVLGNLIGVNIDGKANPNRVGVIVEIGASQSIIGGITSDSANVIAFSTEDGIQVTESSSLANRISGNSIYNNGGIGIDLNKDGITINDSGDGDPGPNENQNSAVLDSAVLVDGLVTVFGSLSSLVSQSFVVELFSSQVGDSLGAGEGRTYLDRDTVSTDITGLVSFQFDVLAQEDEHVYTVTTTDLLGNTSEFSNPIEVTNPNGPGVSNGGLVLWLKANEGITLSTDDVIQWNDYSGFTNHATDVVGVPPLIVNEVFNFNPVVRFDSAQQQQLNIEGGLLRSGVYSDVFVFAVAKTAVLSSPVFREATKLDGAFELGLGQEVSASYSLDPALQEIRSSPLFTGVYSGKNSVLDGSRAIYENGELLAVDMDGDTVLGDSKDFLLRGDGSSFFHGDLAELMVFTSYITGTQRQSIEAYLALKYGVTLGQSILRNYVIAGDTVFKAASEMVLFSNDVAGIGQSDIMALLQPKSMSINDDVVVLMQTPADLNNREYLVWGSNGVATDSVVTSNNPSGMTHRMAREWRVQERGDVGSVSLTINVSKLIGKKSSINDYRLMTSPNPDFLGATSWVPNSVNGNTVIFDGVQFDDLNYFSVAYNQLSDPIAVDDTIIVNEDTSFVDFNVLLNDQDPDSNIDSASFTILINATNGSSTIAGAGIIRYSPNLNFNGLDTVVYEVCDSTSLCDTGYYYITVLPVNDPPIILDDTLRINEDTTNAGVNLVSNDSDIEGLIDSTTLVVLNGPYNGAFINNGDGSIDYTPDADYFGLDSLTYEVCDLGVPLPGACDSATLIIEVSPVSDSPVAVDDTVSTSQGTPISVSWIQNDFDVDFDLDTTSFQLIQTPVSGVTFVVNSGTILLEYDGQPTFLGDDSLVYRVCDLTSPISLCDSAVIRVSVIAGNAPITLVDSITVNEDTLNVLINLVNNDSDPDGNLDSASLIILKDVSNGIVVNNGNGSITYSPNPNYNGKDTLVYQICDSTDLCTSDTLFVTVIPVDDNPVAIDDTITFDSYCTQISVAIGANDQDVDGNLDFTSLTLVGPFLSLGTYGLIAGELQIDYSPDTSFTGPDTIMYIVCDSTSLCDTAEVIVTFTPNLKPSTNSDTVTLNVDSLVAINVLANDSDGDGLDSNSLRIVSSSLGGDLKVVNSFIEVEYTTVGIDTILYEICDLRCLCATDTAYLSVEERPFSLSLNDDQISVRSGCLLKIFDVFENDDLPGIDSSSIVLLPPYDTTTRMRLSFSGQLELDFQDSLLSSGDYLISYQVCDTLLRCEQAQIQLNVLENATPIANDVTVYVLQGESIGVELLESIVDDEVIMPNNFELLDEGVLGGEKFLIGSRLVVDYRFTIDSTGFDTLHYRYCDEQCLCDTGEIAIDVVLDPDKLIIYQGLSPNGDDKNDVWEIELATSYPQNIVQIFNRWGNLVWSATGYDNNEIAWDGVSNVKSYVLNENVALPDGTYYYIFDFGYSGFDKKTGFVVLKRD